MFYGEKKLVKGRAGLWARADTKALAVESLSMEMIVKTIASQLRDIHADVYIHGVPRDAPEHSNRPTSRSSFALVYRKRRFRVNAAAFVGS